MKRLKILILDDNPLCTDKYASILKEQGHEVFCAHHPTQAFEIFKSTPIDIFICDILLPDANGLDILRTIKQNHKSVDVIMVSGQKDLNLVAKAFRIGAFDYIVKPVSAKKLILSIKRTACYQRNISHPSNISNPNSLIDNDLANKIGREFIGVSQQMQHVVNMALLAATDKEMNVMITGDNGTGKEIVARIIHHASERHPEPFCPINSAAIPDTLLESEFFGHKKGTFTGAVENKKGCFELANNGTLFLDEISEMPHGLQAKLLRAIEEKKIKPLGSNEEFEVNLRIISATNSKPEKLISNNKLRIDLFHRLNTFMIHIPPLRDHKQDIEPLTNFFAHDIAQKRKMNPIKIDKRVYQKLNNYNFPGNVRELRNMVNRAILISGTNTLSPNNFKIETMANQKPNAKGSLKLEDNEKKLIHYALIQSNNNNSKAAKLLGISRDTLIRKKRKYNIFLSENNWFSKNPNGNYNFL
ncbi:MAG: sigma-54 dependent transcriptional regulator [Bacteroidetes bacterium]|nr:sigma-54 dependent transcriptional regulator [Bacteroidota bacterium]